MNLNIKCIYCYILMFFTGFYLIFDKSTSSNSTPKENFSLFTDMEINTSYYIGHKDDRNKEPLYWLFMFYIVSLRL